MSDPRIPRTLAEGVARFMRALPPNAPPLAEQLIRDAYFAGAGTLFDMLIRDDAMAPDLPDDEAGVALLERVQTELDGYVNSMLARPAIGRGRPQ
jgi:hypothetical protein